MPTAIFHGVHRGVPDQVAPIGITAEVNKNIKGSTLIHFEESGYGLFYDEKD